MVQTLLSLILSRSREHRAIFYLGAATPAAGRCGIDDLPSNSNRAHRQLLLLQSADDRVVLPADRGRGNRARHGGASSREPCVAGAPSFECEIYIDSMGNVRGDCSNCCHVSNQRLAHFQRVQAAKPTARAAGELLRTTGSISNRKWLRTISRDDQGPWRDSDRRQRRWH